MSLAERAARVGMSLRSIMGRATVSAADQQMRAAIERLHQVAEAEIALNVAGRDHALDQLAEDR